VVTNDDGECSTTAACLSRSEAQADWLDPMVGSRRVLMLHLSRCACYLLVHYFVVNG